MKVRFGVHENVAFWETKYLGEKIEGCIWKTPSTFNLKPRWGSKKKKLRSTYLSWLKAAVLFWKKTKKSANSERVTTTFFSFKAWKFSKKQTDIWSKFECQNWLRCDWIWGHSAVRCSCLVCIRLIDQLLHKIFDCGFLQW